MALPFDFRNPAAPVSGDALDFVFTGLPETQHVSVLGFDAFATGIFRASPKTVYAPGITPRPIGAPKITTIHPSATLAFHFEWGYQPPEGYSQHFHFKSLEPGAAQVLNPYPIYPPAIGQGKIEYSPYIRVQGYVATEWGDTTVINKSELTQYLQPLGFVATSTASQNIGRALRFKFDNPAYLIPPGHALDFDFVLQGGTQGVYAGLGDLTAFGTASVGSSTLDVRAQGFDALAMGAARAMPQWVVRPVSINVAPFGTAYLWNSRQYRAVQGFDASLFGAGSIWNWRQYRNILGFATQAFGVPSLSGGRKTLTLVGIGAPAVPNPLVVNNRADQTVRPSGFTHYAMGSPVVSPRFLRPFGLLATQYGVPLVQRHPHAVGWDSVLWGVPFVYDKTRYIRPTGFHESDAGYPRVFDKAQRLQHIASPITSVFGDVLLRLKNLRIVVQGFDEAAVSPWAEARNRNRYLLASGIAHAVVGGADEIRNKTPSFAPRSWDSLAFGGHDVSHSIRQVRPAGIPAPLNAVGTPSLARTPSLEPRGIGYPAFAGPLVANFRRYLEAVGFDASTAARPTVWYRYRHLNPGGNDASAYGLARLEHGNRELIARGTEFLGWGAPWVSYGQRAIEPTGIKMPEPNATHMVGGTQHIGPDGFVATRWGARIIPESQTLYLQGFANTYGWPSLRNVRQYVLPPSVRTYQEPQQHFGRLAVFNSRQYITQTYDPDSLLNPPSWPIWTLVENRNRYPRASGWVATRMGTPAIDNKARPLLPAGIAAPSWVEGYKWGLVAHRIRHLPLEGMESPYMSSWGIVRNNARLLQPAGLVATAFGGTLVENRSRDFKYIGAIESGVLGYPFVAPAIREITFETRYGIQPPRIELPNVRLHTRYVEPKGIEEKQVGNAALEIHWKKITPRWTMIGRWGYPVLRNLTPELPMRGYDMQAFGETSVRLQWRPVAPDGTDASLFGRTTIADRKQRIQVAGTNMLRIGDKLTVIRTGVPHHGKQYIWLDSLDPLNLPDDGYGIGAPREQVGRPYMQQQVVYPAGIQPDEHFGRPFVHANSVRVEPGIFELTVGEPSVGLRTRSVQVASIESQAGLGKPRLSPHTIYAVVEAPEQARLNHPVPRALHEVNSVVRFGTARVENRHRYIQHHHNDGINYGNFLRFGTGRVHSTRQYIAPTGVQVTRMGWATLPFQLELEQFDASNTMAMGTPRVARPPYVGPQTLTGQGYAATVFGAARVEHFNRTLAARGHDSMAMGTRLSNDTPYQWKGLRVGPLVPTTPQGFAADLFGSTWVSLRVRDVACTGFDAFLCEYDYQAFAQRMRVKNAKTNERSRKFVGGKGHVSHAVGTPGIRNGVHYIRPDGNAEQYRKGAF